MVLFFPFQLLSHYLRCLQLAQTLQGEEVLFPMSENYRSFLEAKGITTFPYEGLPTQAVMEDAQDFQFSWMKKEVLEKVFLEQVKMLRQYQPRVVVGDASFTLRLAAAHVGVPYVSLINAYMSDYYALPRSLPPNHAVPRTFSFLPSKLYQAISSQAERAVLKWLQRPFRKLAKQYGLPVKKHLLQELQGDLTLLLDLPELFPQKKLPTNHTFIGPLYDTKAYTEDRILQWLQKEKKTLFVTVGSSGDLSKFYFLTDASYGQYNVLVAGKEAHLLNAPHTFCQEFIHLDSLLPHIDLFLCHAGNGSMYQALKAGIPLLCAPSHFEQEWNLQALERRGWGARLQGLAQVGEQIEAWASLRHSAAWKSKRPSFDMGETKRLFYQHIQTV